MEIFLKTKRIYLRKFNSSEFDLLFQLDSDPEVMKFITLGKPRNMQEIKEISMPMVMKSYTNGDDFGIFCAHLSENNKFIGWFQFEIDKNFDNTIEIGWRLKKNAWGNGYATEVAKSLVQKGVQINKSIVAEAMNDNTASINVMKKAGLTFVEEFWGDYKPHSGKLDMRYMLISKAFVQ
jgi:RimJ/RimL family protein N-acetyltransferase